MAMADAANTSRFEDDTNRELGDHTETQSVPAPVDAREIGANAGSSTDQDGDGQETQNEGRAAPRFTLLIRAAKIVSSHGEFVCVVRDVSETGVAVRLFHAVPDGDPLELHMPGGGVHEMQNVWQRDNEAGFQFTNPIDVNRMIHQIGEFPKRGLRLGLFFPIMIKTLRGTSEAVVENISQQGARFESEEDFAIDQTVRITCEEGGGALKDVRAKIRWRRDSQYGVVFDDTLTLSDFSRFAARLQCPRLLD
ncbi:PilZ domain-containing protein [Erythrobacter sp. Alg231-14]|uniref:PilZ domain-containing protein n=1 Tax=Erythrobacter sp. Alg231-14 TaxID=1922225 RepID=UPI00307BDAFB